MITCCSDGTRPVIFKIERIDYGIIDNKEQYFKKNAKSLYIKRAFYPDLAKVYFPFLTAAIT